jgi:hypothetical protein
MDIHIEIPEGVSVADLDEGLARVRDDLNLDITLA